MINKTLHPMGESSRSQFSICGILILTAAIAAWFWIFSELQLVELAVFTGIAVTSGILAHFLYSFWLPSRVTVFATVLLIYSSILVALVLLESNSSISLSSCRELLVDVLMQPIEMLTHAKTTRQIRFGSVVFFSTLFFSLAHSLRPSFPSALITAFGIGIGYAVGILMLMYAA